MSDNAQLTTHLAMDSMSQLVISNSTTSVGVGRRMMVSLPMLRMAAGSTMPTS